MTRQLGIIIFVCFGALAALASRGAAVEPDMPPTVVAGAELVEVFGDDRFFAGSAGTWKGKACLLNPDVAPPERAADIGVGRLHPIYPGTADLRPAFLRPA